MNLHDGVLSIRLAFWDELSVGVTFLSGKVTKTIVIRKTCSLSASIKYIEAINILQQMSRLRMTYPRIR
jgi:hypothetical protein